MTRRQSIRSFTYCAIGALTVALCGVFWPSGAPSTAAAASAQDSLWREAAPDTLNALKQGRQSRPAPQRYKVFQLNEAALVDLLAAAPLESSAASKDLQSEITLPMPDGELARFRFVESPIMEPELAAQLPEIKTYRGWGIDDPTATTRFSKTASGFRAIVLSARDSFHIEPLSDGDARGYMSYFMRDAGGDSRVHCPVGPGDSATARRAGGALGRPAARDNLSALQSATNTTGTTLRQFRLAVAATVEFTNAHGGVDSAMQDIVVTISDVNAIYERELAVRLVLVNNNRSIIFTNPTPSLYQYTSGNVNLLIDENQETLDQVIGEANYDIGHVFDTNSMGAEGKAEIGAVCEDSEKGKGASNNLGHQPFFKTVAHEIGHQFGAQHTFNGGVASNRNDNTAYEPGLGRTIMSYGQGRIGYFHGTSLRLISDYLDSCGCGTVTNNNNAPPTVSVPPPRFSPYGAAFIIPGRTPFTLTASGSDPDADALTYSWEDIDSGSPGPAGEDRGDNPLFRSFAPVSDPWRTFPQMEVLLDGTQDIEEETLPETLRFLWFRVTARDNRGGYAWGNVVLNVCGHLGPFAVTQPTAGTQTLVGSPLSVTWDVASTDLSPINASDVRILLSTDNGLSFPIVLAASTPNDGSFTFTVPCANAQQARIKVEAVGNIFFNVSPAFTISGPTITTTGSLTVTRGGPLATAPVATVADGRDAAGSLTVTSRLPLPNGVSLRLINNNGTISAEASADCSTPATTHPITIEVMNSVGCIASTTFNLVVNQNPPPTLGVYSSVNVIASYSTSVSPSTPPADPEGNFTRLTVSPETLLGGGDLSVDQATGIVSIRTVGATQIGTYQIQVRAEDSCGAAATRNFFLTVNNSPPQIAPVANSVRTTQGAASPVSPITIATVSDQQEAAGNLTVTATAVPGITVYLSNKGGAIAAFATATCAVTPAAYNATLTVTDRERATATATFPVIVDPNPPPTLGAYFDSAVTAGGSVIIVPTVPPSDANNAVTFSASPQTFSNGAGQVITFADGRVRVDTQPATTPGIYQILVTARDACGAQTTKSFKLTVRSATCVMEQSVIFAADTGNHRIQRFNGANWNVIGSGAQGSGLGQFTSPESVMASPDGRKIYVADTGNLRVQWSQDSGVTWAVFSSGLIPQGLALDRDGHLYVSDARDNRVVRYAGGVPGAPIVLAASGSGAGQVRNPNGLAIDCRMNLYVADTGNNRVLVIPTADSTMIANTGAVVAAFGAGTNPAQVSAPQGVAVANNGRLYIADTGNNRVLMMASAPAPGAAAILCTLGSALGQTRGPEGVTIAAFTAGPLAGVSSISVSDTNNNRIQAAGLPLAAGSWRLLGGGPASGTGSFRLPSKLR